MMVGFRGRFGSTQYIPKKPVKWGIEAFTLADTTTGSMLNILVYTGAQTRDDASLPLCQCWQKQCWQKQCCISFHSTWEGPPHIFATDSTPVYLWYIQTLAEQQTHYTGTIIKNRVGLPDAIGSPLTLGPCSSVVSGSWSLPGEQNPRRHQ